MKIVSLIQRSDKIRTREGNCSIEKVKGIFQGLARFITSERRKDNITFLEAQTKKGILFYESLTKKEAGGSAERREQMMVRLRKVFITYKEGLDNLSCTYADDIEICTHLRMLCENIDDWSQKYQEKKCIIKKTH